MSSFLDTYKNKLTLIIIALNLLSWTVPLQSKQDIAKSECASFKHEAYDNIFTYSAFVNGQENYKTVIDNCKLPLPFIIGGSPAKPKEFPHMARLGFAQKGSKETNWFCGGVLISNKFVLTAAHCFHSPNGILNRVRVGDFIFNSDADDARPVEFDVLHNIPHPQYKGDQLYNDVGLVELMHPANLSEYIAPACLPSSNGDNYDRFIAVGWGATRFARSDSDMLLKVTLERYDAELCGQFIEDSVRMPFGLDSNSQICAGSTERKDACHGDSGGPLLLAHNEFPCMHYVIGITSTGFGCGFANIPGIYTRVFFYLSWIEKIVWQI